MHHFHYSDLKLHGVQICFATKGNELVNACGNFDALSAGEQIPGFSKT